MVTEACAAATPVYVPWTDRCRGRFARFHGHLLSQRRTRHWTGTLESCALWQCTEVDDTARVAARVAQMLLRFTERSVRTLDLTAVDALKRLARHDLYESS